MGGVLQGVTSESFVYGCAPRVLFRGHGEDWRGDDSCGEMQNQQTLVNVHDNSHCCCLVSFSKFIKDESVSQNDS